MKAKAVPATPIGIQPESMSKAAINGVTLGVKTPSRMHVYVNQQIYIGWRSPFSSLFPKVF